MASLVCLGLGTCARAYLAAFGTRHGVTGTSRTPQAHPTPGVAMLTFDGATSSPELRAAVAGATHLLISAPPGETGDPVLHALAPEIAAAPTLQSIVYLSSLSVYGDHGGAWIDETTTTAPSHRRGVARVDAEQAWQALGQRRRTPVAILRLAGIYGPGQNAFTRLKAGRAHRIDKAGHVSNRIHVADIAQAIDAAFTHRFDGVVNVADGAPAPPGEVIAFAAALLGVEPPPLVSFEQAQRTLSPMLLSFYDGCARVKNDKLRNELGVTLRYPDYRDGLKALRDEGTAQT